MTRNRETIDMNRTAIIAVLAGPLLLTACTLNIGGKSTPTAAAAAHQAQAQNPADMPCMADPIFNLTEGGQRKAIHLCFAPDNTLKYVVKVLGPAELKQEAATPAPAAKPKRTTSKVRFSGDGDDAMRTFSDKAAKLQLEVQREIARLQKQNRIDAEVARQRAAADRALTASRPDSKP